MSRTKSKSSNTHSRISNNNSSNSNDKSHMQFILKLLIFISVSSICITTLLYTQLDKHHQLQQQQQPQQISDYVKDSVLVRNQIEDHPILNTSKDSSKSIHSSTNGGTRMSNGSNLQKEKMNNEIKPKSLLLEDHHSKTTNTTTSYVTSTTTNNSTTDNNNNKKQKLINILQKAGVTLTPSLLSKLPTYSQVISQYGSEPKIIGLESCATFQSIIPENDAYIGPSGIFNTGTNLLADLLLNYCELPKRRKNVSDEEARKFGQVKRLKSGMLWHVPWGKHNPISLRLHHKAIIGSEGINQSHVLPVVTIKDPYHWMGSMCRHPYAANWKHTKDICPNLIDTKTGLPTNVDISFTKSKHVRYESLVGLWNEWYGDYLSSIKDFPRLIIRFEDLLFHLDEVITQVCTCGGGTLKNYDKENGGFVLQEKNAKASHNNGSNGLVSAMLRYANESKRTEKFTDVDLEYANEHLRKDLLDLFGYTTPGR